MGCYLLVYYLHYTLNLYHVCCMMVSHNLYRRSCYFYSGNISISVLGINTDGNIKDLILILSNMCTLETYRPFII